MTTIQETGRIHKCSSCRVKTIATSHNGMVMLRVGKRIVAAPSLTVSCDCGHLNHISVAKSENGVD